MARALLIILLGSLAGCGGPPEGHSPSSSESSAAPLVKPAVDTPVPEGVNEDAGAKGAKGAVEVLSNYYDLLKTGRLDDASQLWSPPDATALRLSEQSLSDYQSREVDIGEPGRIEGAAGSLYISIPIQIDAHKAGEDVHLSGEATLRRVNDVPGATPEQLSWRITRIDLQPAEQDPDDQN